ncbi:hypothetical protein Lser_V15G00493 [Lactuca serriola]
MFLNSRIPKKALSNHHINLKFSIYSTKFLSSLVSALQVPSIFPTKPHNQQNFPTTFDPYQYLNESAKSRDYTHEETKIIHTHFLKTNAFHSNPEFSNYLLRCYYKASAFDHALKVFDAIPHPNINSWNLIISCHNGNLRYAESWGSFCRMHSLGFYPNEFTYGSAISGCIASNFVNCGKQLYSLALKDGFSLDGYVRSGMIDLFLKSCNFNDALRVFYDESCGNVVCWNAIISGAIKHNEDRLGLNLFQQMCRGLPSPNKFTFPSVFSACAKCQQLDLGRLVHGLVIKYGDGEDVFVSTAIIDFYSKCGQVDEAVKIFSRMSVHNVVSWTAIITGFVQKGEFESALQLFKEMLSLKVEINNYTLTSVLSACVNPILLFQIHCWICKTGFYSDPTVKNSLINSYSRTGAVESSQQIFKDSKDSMNPSTWAAMITCFSQNGRLEKTFSLLKRMFREGLKPDKSCIPSVLSITDRLQLGEQIHCYTHKTGIFNNPLVGCSLFTMYSKCDCLKESYKIFREIPEKDEVSWASMIAGFTEHGFAYKAIELFQEMLVNHIVLDEKTLTPVLAACASLQSLKSGKEIHGFFFRRLIFAGSPIVHMYSKCGNLKSAKLVFNMMPFKDPVSCSSLVSSYAQNGQIEDAFHLFRELIVSDFEVDSFTISSILRSVNRPETGIQLHGRIVKLGLESDTSIGSSLVTMYSKFGNLEDCCKSFEQIDNPDVITWTAMINGYAQNGDGLAALKVYELMVESGIKPDSVTFVGVLSACSHGGLVEEGYCYLESMVKDYGIEPGLRHYACMVDVLGRAGRLEEAVGFIGKMPVEPDGLVWGTLLAACKVHGDVEIGRMAAEKFIELAPLSDGGYVGLSNILAELGNWEEVLKIRNEMKGTGIKKQPGWSYV